MSLDPGTRLGTYEILERLGAGGMGEVYRARDTVLKRDVAIKVLPPAFAHEPARLTRFTREAEVLASLNHPNIAAIYGLEDGALVMELVEGETLAEIIRRGPLSLDTALAYADQIAAALDVAHEKGIVHRDPQTRERESHARRPRKGAGFRSGLGGTRARVRKCRRCRKLADAHHAGNAGWSRPGHCGLYGARTGSRPARRPARRYLGLRCHPV